MKENISRILISAADIEQRNRELAEQITTDYTGKALTVVVISNGALFFAADLVRLIPLPLQLDSIGVSSYIGSESRALKIRSDLKTDIRGRHVLVLDEIFDSGQTLAGTVAHLDKLEPCSIRTGVLLDKEVPHRTSLRPDYRGFVIEDAFVVGYGLDYNEEYRNLPYVGVLRQTEPPIMPGD